MLDTLKKFDKKFWFVIGGIFGILILVIVAMMVLSALSGPGNDYAKLEEKISKAAKDYVNDEGHTAPEPGQSVEVTTETLVAEGYLKDLSKYLKDTCTGTVTVMNNGGVGLYLPHLSCSEYQTRTIADEIIDSQLLDDEKAKEYVGGLYKVGDEYIFRGKDVNNHLTIGGVNWRILKIDANGNLRLIKTEPEKTGAQWDTKYNTEADRQYGITNYRTSLILETLENSYNGFQEDNKKHLIPHDTCVGKRPKKNLDISLETDCAEVVEGKYIETLNLTDVPIASLDENCTSITSRSCGNYNYLSAIDSAWTTISTSDNTYEAYLTASVADITEARTKQSYYWVIHISGKELYTSGTGTREDPYVIG